MDGVRPVLLSVSDLTKSYGSVQAVNGISFSVPKATVFTVLGPNGAGKTTTLEMLEGIRHPDSGEIEIFGRRVKRVTRSIKERMGVLLQDGNFEPYLKVGEVLHLFASFFRQPRPIDEILERVALTEKASAFVKNLSGGQKQRLAVGVALVNDPDLLLLDEPTTGFDPQARRNLWDIFEELKEQHKTMILTTHYMEEAEALSDHVCIMDRGVIIAEGTPQKLAASLGQDSIIEFPASGLSDTATDALTELWPRASWSDSTVRLSVADLTTAMERLVAWSRTHRVPLQHVAVRQPNLEDVFLSLTGRSLRD